MEKDFLNELKLMAETMQMTEYVAIPCSQISKYIEIANKCNVKLGIENIFCRLRGAEEDTITVTGIRINTNKFITSTSCKRVPVHIKKPEF